MASMVVAESNSKEGTVMTCTKEMLAISIALALLWHAPIARGQITYVDADPIVNGSAGNTMRSDGINWTNLEGGDVGSAGGGTQGNNWKHRIFGGGPGGNILEADNSPAGNNDELVTTISGLTPGATYDIYGYQRWRDTSGGDDGQIRFGTTGTGSASAAPITQASTGLNLYVDGGSTGFAAAGHFTNSEFNDMTWDVGDGTLNMIEHGLGEFIASNMGEISIWIDDGDGNNSSRTWYEGVGFELVPAAASVPEPCTIFIWSILGTIGLCFGIWRKGTLSGIRTSGNV